MTFALTPERWRQVRQIFEDAMEQPLAEAPAFLAQACGTDVELRREVEDMLAACATVSDFLESSPRQLAAEALGTAPQLTLQAGQQLEHYKILSLLGKGGMGEVYLAQDQRLPRQVALKVLPASYTDDQARVRRFEQEARAASALNHPNITMIFDIGQADCGHFIAMELVAGQTLRAQLGEATRRGEKPPLSAVLEIAAQIASALAAAHEAGVVHRDIKPENIMLRPDGYVKVLDFGLAKLTETRKAERGARNEETEIHRSSFRDHPSTAPGTIMGTISYMSPEQVRGQAVDARSDLFSLGVVLYEMVTGQLPFDGETTSDVLAAILKSEPPVLASLLPTAPAGIQRIINLALCKERGGRYQTAHELLHDLRALQRSLERELEHGVTAELPNTISDASGNAAVRTQSSAEYVVNEIKRHKWMASAVLLVLLLLAAFGGWRYWQTADNAIDSIAVLPFVNLNADPNSEYLSDGLADSTINGLAQLSGLRVTALSSVLRYKQAEADAQAIGKALNVRAVLTGRLRQQGDALIVSAELVDVRDQHRIWGQQYNRKLSDLLTVQQEIARDISAQLRLHLSGAEQQRLGKSYTQNGAAYQLYLQGRYHWNKRSADGLQRAIEYFNQAIAQDGNYALAWAGLADCYSLLANYSGISPMESLPKAKAAAEKALALDDTLAEAHTSLGLVKRDYDWDFAGAEAAFQRAIELKPSYATAWQWRAENCVTLKRLDEAIAAMRRAHELDPFSLIISSEVGWAYYQARRFDEAVSPILKALELDGNFARGYFFLGRVYEQQRKYPEALAATAEALKRANNYSLFLASLGHIYGLSGQRDEAEKILAQLQERAGREYVSPVAFALVQTGLGHTEQALAALQQAYTNRDTIFIAYLRDPQLESLQTHPRYQEWLKRLGLVP
jgi:serine/threonine-protein kinase